MLRIGWQKAQAKFVAQHRVRKSIEAREDGPSYVLQVWDYMVEVEGSDGEPVRLVIRMRNPSLDLPELGGTVPVLVNRKRTKAAFDLKDPRLDWQAARKAREERERAEDEARFEAKRRGLD